MATSRNEATASSSSTKICRHPWLLSSIICGLFGVLLSYSSSYLFNDSGAWISMSRQTGVSPLWVITFWSVAQWIPRRIYDSHWMNEVAWKFWEDSYGSSQQNRTNFFTEEDIPVIYVQNHSLDELVPYLERTYGKDWRKRPLLLKGLWNTSDLSAHRRLSLPGLLEETMTVPYFTDARRIGALSPDGVASIQDIVSNMSSHGAPHKIGTQLFLKKYPELIREVAPLPIVTLLFGPYFSANSIRGSGPFLLFPALTTVPLFVGNSRPVVANNHSAHFSTVDEQASIQSTADATNQEQGVPIHAHTALHCEPIGNVAVQLSGQKQWTLVRPDYSYRLRPTLAPDGRAFFASWLSWPGESTRVEDGYRLPFYHAITEAGDAIWVPTWTWHRVDYISTHASSSLKSNLTNNLDDFHSQSIAIGASLFHFRPKDFVVNNPLFAVLILPSILLELIGYKTQ